MSILGIDVSHYQKNIDWGKVREDGIKFAILKAMYETSHKPDEYFKSNYLGCVANGIKKGAYIFLGSKSISNPKEDAEAFLDIIDGRKLEYGIWLDAEAASIRALGKNRISDVLITQANIFEWAGYKVGIYTNLDWYKNVLDIDLLRNKYPFWVARYPKDDNGSMKTTLSPKAYAEAWQYSSKGKVSGIRGNVDLDIDYSYEHWCDCYDKALQVLAGKYGSANTKPTRQQRLEAEGYNYREVQNMVNAIYKVRTRK